MGPVFGISNTFYTAFILLNISRQDILHLTVIDDQVSVMSHRYLVLGLLSEAPMTGYEIKKRVGTSLKSVTHASYGTLYPTLHRLLAEGAVRMEEQPQTHRPARKVYQITERGKRELEAWLQQPPAADQVRREFLLKLFLAHTLPPEDLKSLCYHRRAATEAQLTELQQANDALNGRTARTQRWVQDYTIELCKAELNWLNRLIAQIETGSGHEEHLLGT
jgi:PadR family transcriptional regulator AphA